MALRAPHPDKHTPRQLSTATKRKTGQIRVNTKPKGIKGKEPFVVYAPSNGAAAGVWVCGVRPGQIIGANETHFGRRLAPA